MRVEFIHKCDDYSYFYRLKDELTDLYDKNIEIHAFLGCDPDGVYLYSDREKQEYFIEIFSPGLDRNLPKEYFRTILGGLNYTLEEVIICGTLKSATSSKGIASLSNILYIKVLIDGDEVFEYKNNI